MRWDRTSAERLVDAAQNDALTVERSAWTMNVHNTLYGVPMPEIAGSQIVGFGAGINPESLSGAGAAFTARFKRVRLYELS